MKRITFLPFLLLVITFMLASCEEDKYADWKILNKQWIENYFEKHKDDAGFHRTESGLCYKVIHQGEMGRPNLQSSYITANYKGWLIDGTVFDSGEYKSFLYNAIPGWQEAIVKMNVGGKYMLYVPADLGYGEEGLGDIPPHSTLIFEVELLDSRNQL